MGDGSFPPEFWQQFRASVKAAKADAPIIGELWKKDEILPKDSWRSGRHDDELSLPQCDFRLLRHGG